MLHPKIVTLYFNFSRVFEVIHYINPPYFSCADLIPVDKNDPPDAFGINGMMKYLQQLGVNPDNVSALIALEITRADGMEELTKPGFVDGWMENGYDFELEKGGCTRQIAKLF